LKLNSLDRLGNAAAAGLVTKVHILAVACCVILVDHTANGDFSRGVSAVAILSEDIALRGADCDIVAHARLFH